MQGPQHLFAVAIIVLFCAVSEQYGKSSKRKRKEESTFLSLYRNNFQCEWHCSCDTTGRTLLPDVWKTRFMLEAKKQARKLIGISEISCRIQTTQPVIIFKDLIKNLEWKSSRRFWRVKPKNSIHLNKRSGDVVVRALASRECGTGSISRLGIKCGLSLLVPFSAPWGFPPGTSVCPSPQKHAFD